MNHIILYNSSIVHTKNQVLLNFYRFYRSKKDTQGCFYKVSIISEAEQKATIPAEQR